MTPATYTCSTESLAVGRTTFTYVQLESSKDDAYGAYDDKVTYFQDGIICILNIAYQINGGAHGWQQVTTTIVNVDARGRHCRRGRGSLRWQPELPVPQDPGRRSRQKSLRPVWNGPLPTARRKEQGRPCGLGPRVLPDAQRHARMDGTIPRGQLRLGL